MTENLQGKKICVLINSMAGGGAEKVVATLYPEYLAAGLDVSLLCLEENNFHTIEGVTPIHLSSQTGSDEGKLTKLISLFNFAFKLRAYARKNKIDLVQSHIYRSNYVNVLARLLGSKHKVQIVNHGIPDQYKTEGMLGKIYRTLIGWFYPKADQLVCPSQGMIDAFVEMGVQRERTRLIRNPFDLEEIRTKSTELPEFEFNPDKKYIISIGRLQPVKRMDEAIWAFYELQKEREDVEMILLGDGKQRDVITDLVMELAIGKKVHLAGQVKNPFGYLARSDVLLSSSAFEGFSNVIVEALALGIPVVSTDCESGPREIMAPGTKRKKVIAPGAVEKVKHGLLVAAGNIQGMTAAMQHMLEDAEMSRIFTDNGPARAQRFDKQTIASEYLAHSAALLGQ